MGKLNARPMRNKDHSGDKDQLGNHRCNDNWKKKIDEDNVLNNTAIENARA